MGQSNEKTVNPLYTGASARSVKTVCRNQETMTRKRLESLTVESHMREAVPENRMGRPRPWGCGDVWGGREPLGR